MEFSRELLFFFSALGAFNGIVMGFYFLFLAKPRHISNRFLGAMLLMLSIRIGKSVFFYFNPDLAIIYLQFGLTACFFVGPFLFFYIESMVQPNSAIKSTWKYHIFIMASVALIVGYLYPFETNITLWRPYIIHSIYFQWLLYIIASAYVLRNTIKELFIKQQKLRSQQIWLLSILIGNIVILTAYYSFHYTYYIVGALSFSFIFYLLFLFIFFTKKKNPILFNGSEKYAERKIEPSQATILMEKLGLVMEEKELYKNANLKSSDVAKQLNISTHQLSQLLNDNVGKSFPVFINEYRIEEAKNIVRTNNQLTLEAIGYECGFNSKSTFYTAFKKLTGSTPAKFKEQL